MGHIYGYNSYYTTRDQTSKKNTFLFNGRLLCNLKCLSVRSAGLTGVTRFDLVLFQERLKRFSKQLVSHSVCYTLSDNRFIL